MRVWFGTHPEQHFKSVIPADVRAATDTLDAVWSTNATREPTPSPEWPHGAETAQRWAQAAAKADEANSLFVADCELYRTALDVFLADRPLFNQNLERVAKCLRWVRQARPELRTLLYPGLPPFVGLAANQYTAAQRKAHVSAERDALWTYTDANLIEAYMPDLGAGRFRALAAWEGELLARLEESDKRETFILIGDVYANADRYVGDMAYRVMLETVDELGAKPMVWNAGASGWNVIKRIAAK